MLIESCGVKVLAASIGGASGLMFGVGLADHPNIIETIMAGGLGAGLSVFMVKWLLGQYNTAISRLAKIEDERALLVRETVASLDRTTERSDKLINSVAELIEASHERGQEVCELISELKQRPCMYRERPIQ